MGQSESVEQRIQSPAEQTDAVEEISRELYKQPWSELSRRQQEQVKQYTNSIRRYASKLGNKSLDFEMFTDNQRKRLFQLAALDFQIEQIDSLYTQNIEKVNHDLRAKKLAVSRLAPTRTNYAIDIEVNKSRRERKKRLNKDIETLKKQLVALSATTDATREKFIKKRGKLLELQF